MCVDLRLRERYISATFGTELRNQIATTDGANLWHAIRGRLRTTTAKRLSAYNVDDGVATTTTLSFITERCHSASNQREN